MIRILFVRSARMAIFLLQMLIPKRSLKKSLQMLSDTVLVTKRHNKRRAQSGFRIAAKKQVYAMETWLRGEEANDRREVASPETAWLAGEKPIIKGSDATATKEPANMSRAPIEHIIKRAFLEVKLA